MTVSDAKPRYGGARRGLPDWADVAGSTNPGVPLLPLELELSLLSDSTDADRAEIAVEAGVRKLENLLRSAQALDRMVSLSVLLAGLQGCSFDEAALLIGREPPILEKFVRGEATVPERVMNRVRRLDEVLRNLHKVLEPTATAKWLRTSIPSLGNESPLNAISKGNLRKVEELTRGYCAPVVHS